jgi:D-arginine dehydrogenase
MKVDFLVIGGGVAGASAAYFLSPHGSVALIEREEHFSYHSSGRTAAQFTVGIGAPIMRAMAQASRHFLEEPPDGFCTHPILSPRGCLTVGRGEQEEILGRLHDRILSVGARADYLDKEAALALFPALVPDKIDAGVYEPDAMDIDVDVLLQGYLRGAKARGAALITRASVESIRRENGAWITRSGEAEITAPILINAAGAWVDEVTLLAGLEPIGLVPYRRTAFTFNLQKDFDTRSWPHVGSVDYDWYVKPEPGCLMGSLSDAVASQPGDVYAEDIDVAQAIENIEAGTNLRVGRPLSQWAGLRSFVKDRNPVAGTRPDSPGFFWLAGQGGCGILTSPAMGQALAALVTQGALPAHLAQFGLHADDLSPVRAGLGNGG